MLSGEFFEAWNGELHKPRFVGGLDAQAAAQSCGLSLRVGIIFRAPEIDCGGETLLGGFWWNGKTLQSEIFTVDSETLTRLPGAGLNHDLLPPPYIAVAAVSGRGHVVHVWFKAIWASGRQFAWVDSLGERSYAEQLSSMGRVFFKCLSQRDLGAVINAVHQTDMGYLWEGRPDFLVWDQDRPEITEIHEVRGFIPGSFPEYDRQFEKKKNFYELLGSRFKFLEVSSYEDRSPRLAINYQKRWREPMLEFGNIRPAARDFIGKTCHSILADLSAATS